MDVRGNVRGKGVESGHLSTDRLPERPGAGRIELRLDKDDPDTVFPRFFDDLRQAAGGGFTPAELDGYPLDLSREVFCPGDILSELAQLLPLGADVLGIANEYYYIAGEQGTLEAGRARAAFPLRFTRDGERHEVTIRMKRRPNGHLGATWTIYAIETMQ